MLYIMWLSPVSCYFLALGHKYLLQHPVLKHSQCVVLPYCETPSVTVSSNNSHNYSFV